MNDVNVIHPIAGILKRRFHVLHGEIRLTPTKVCKVIGACAVLHNFAVDMGESNDFVGDDFESNDFVENFVGEQSGTLFRDQYIYQHFSP